MIQHSTFSLRAPAMCSRWLLSLIILGANPGSVAHSAPHVFFAEDGRVRLRTLAQNPWNPAAACGSGGSLSSDSSYVLMITYCSLDRTNDSGGQDMYKVPFGAPPELITATMSGAAVGGNFFGQLVDTSFSDNRRWATFPSARLDIIPGPQNTYQQIYLWNAESGSITRVTETQDGSPGIGHSQLGLPSGDGNYVALQTDAVNLIDTFPGGSTDRRFLLRNLPSREFQHLSACGTSPGYLRGYNFSEGLAFMQQCITNPNFGSGPGYLLRQSPDWQDIPYAFGEDGAPREIWSAKMAAKGGAMLFWEAIVVDGVRRRGNLHVRLLLEERSINLGQAQDALVSANLSTAVVMKPHSDGATEWYRVRRIDLLSGDSSEVPLGRSKLPGAPGFTWLYLYDIGDDGRLLLMGFDSVDVPVHGDWLGGASQRYAVMAVADLSVVFESGFE